MTLILRNGSQGSMSSSKVKCSSDRKCAVSFLNVLGSLSEQTLYCFSIYDLNEDGYISREEMLTMMGSCLSKVKGGQDDTEEDEGIKDLMEMTLKRMDHDKDGKISHEDFSRTVSQDVLMLEAFGSCLPSGRAGQDFVSSILDAKIV